MERILVERIMEDAWGDNRKAKRIIIKAETGFSPMQYEDGYKNRLTITSNSIAYVQEPHSKTLENYKWSYSTMSFPFALSFIEIAKQVEKIIEQEPNFACCDGDRFIFIIIYEDGRKESRELFGAAEMFENCFSIIRKMIPQIEEIPDMILREMDDDEDDE